MLKHSVKENYPIRYWRDKRLEEDCLICHSERMAWCVKCKQDQNPMTCKALKPIFTAAICLTNAYHCRCTLLLTTAFKGLRTEGTVCSTFRSSGHIYSSSCSSMLGPLCRSFHFMMIICIVSSGYSCFLNILLYLLFSPSGLVCRATIRSGAWPPVCHQHQC